MKFLPYILKHLRRSWIRTGSTVAAMAVCIFLFITLQTVIAAVNWGLKSANASRLVTRHSVSLVFNLPRPYGEKIAALPGVRAVVGGNWFGGIYREPRDFFPSFAIDDDAYLRMYPEFEVPADQKQAFLADLRGCVVGRATAARFGWKLGDSFQMRSSIYTYRAPEPYEFVVRGIYEVDEVRHPATDPTLMFFHHRYLEEKTGRQVGVGTYTVEIDDPRRAGDVSKAIDTLFENSATPTRTETEAAFRAGLVSLAGNLALLLNGIALAVTFTILLVTANSMSMAVRERSNEIAVLKTLGFTSRLVMGLILGEALLLGALGGGLGIALGRAVIQVLPRVPLLGDAVRGFPNLGLSLATGSLGIGVALALSMAAGFLPALFAYRARIVKALREV